MSPDKILKVGAPQDIYDFHRSVEIASFVGAPQINLLPAYWDGAEGGSVRFGQTALDPGKPFAIAFLRGRRSFSLAFVRKTSFSARLMARKCAAFSWTSNPSDFNRP